GAARGSATADSSRLMVRARLIGDMVSSAVPDRALARKPSPRLRAFAPSTLTPVSVGTLSREARGPSPESLTWVQRIGVEDAIVAALTVAAAVLRFALIAHQGYWFDEANTAQLVSFSPGPMLTLIKHYESTPPLYYCVAWVWARIFG